MTMPLARGLSLLLGLAVIASCRGALGPAEDTVPPTYRITGVEVRALDRRAAGGTIHYVHADTLRGQVAFTLGTRGVRVAGSAGASAAAGDERPGVIENPTVADRSWLSVDRAVRHRGVEIPAHTNLLAVEAVRTSFDGTMSDLLFPPLSPFVIGEVHVRTRAFELPAGPAVFTFRWETAAGERFGDTVRVYVDLPAP